MKRNQKTDFHLVEISTVHFHTVKHQAQKSMKPVRASYKPYSCFFVTPLVFNYDETGAYFLSGTRIIYERKFLLELRNSPLSRTPPRNLPLIPGVTCDGKVKPTNPKDNGVPTTETDNDKNDHG